MKKFELKLRNIDFYPSNNISMTETEAVVSLVDGGVLSKGIKVNNATLELNITGGSSDSDTIKVFDTEGGIIDYIKPYGKNKIHINITQELADALKKGNSKLTVALKAEGVNVPYKIQGGSDLIGPTVYVEYLPEDLYSPDNAYMDISAGRAGTGKINLATGQLRFIHNDVSAGSDIGISHVFNTGKGWKLNLEQFLVQEKTVSGEQLSSELYSYIDGEGNRHIFEERFFYKSGGEKIYLEKGRVTVKPDGKLIYTAGGEETEVETDRRTTSGLTLETDYSGFAGSKKLELRSEDRARLEEEINELKYQINDLIYSQYAEAKDAEFEDLINAEKTVTEKSLNLQNMTKPASIPSSFVTEYFTGNNTGFYYREGQLTGQDKYNKLIKKDYYPIGNYYNYGTGGVGFDPNSLRFVYNDPTGRLYVERVENREAASIDINDTEMMRENYFRNIFQEGRDQCEQNITGKSFPYELINFYNQKELVDAQNILKSKKDAYAKKLLGANADSSSLDRAAALENFKRAAEALDKARNVYERKKFELDRLKEHEPVRFITDGEGNVLGFNENGQLAVIADSYEKVVFIEFENGNIKKLIGSNKKEVLFEYNDNLLISVTDAKGKITYGYDDNCRMNKITLRDGRECNYTYDDSGNLLAAVISDGLGVALKMQNGKYVKITELTNLNEVSDGEINSNNGTAKYFSALTYCGSDGCGTDGFSGGAYFSWSGQEGKSTDIDYIDCRTTKITDGNGVETAYIFDITGRPVTVYGDNRTISQDYADEGRSFTIKQLSASENLLSGTMTAEPGALNPEQPALAYEEITGFTNFPVKANGELCTDYVLSGWAEADSAFIARNRKTEYNEESIEGRHIASFDDYKKNRRFELRAEVKYFADTEPDIYYCSFDWQNTEKQFCAFPVTLRDGTLAADIQYIKVFADYSYNTGNAVFEDITLKEGSWRYSELDKDGKVTESWTSGGDRTYYTYDERDNMIKSVYADLDGAEFVTTYEYNLKDKLIRTVGYNGLIKENEFDDKGNIVKSFTYSKYDSSSRLYTYEKPEDKEKEEDEDKNFTSGYDHLNGALTGIGGNTDGEHNSNAMKYTSDFLTKLTSGGTEYTYSYDGWGRRTSVKINGAGYLAAEYIDGAQANGFSDKAITALANGYKLETIFDKYGRVREINRIVNDVAVDFVKYEYNTDGNITKETDYTVMPAKVTNYTYDKFGRLINKSGGGVSTHSEYDKYGNADKVSMTIDGTERKYEYSYDATPEAKLNEALLPNGAVEKFKYDNFGRLSQISTVKENAPLFSKHMYYLQKGDKASNLISSIRYGISGRILDGLKYRYDDEGNITEVSENGILKVRYTYDKLNRLAREDNKDMNATVTYDYDTNGNILNKHNYAFTLKDFNELTNGESVSYTYDEGFNDRLTSYNGQATGNYDGIGNPVIYRGHNLTWDGRNLKSYDNVTFTYNASGIRTSKTGGGITTQYYLDGTKILAEKRNGSNIYYNYGADGISGFTYNGNEYAYRKSLQGDITHIYQVSAGSVTLVGRYNYNAWGLCTTELDTNGIATLNPFRYRGYYFDTATGLYYLNSRYYDAEACRFINADTIDHLHSVNINGLNLYKYANNNPISLIDPTGKCPFSGIFSARCNCHYQAIGNAVNVAADWVNGSIIQPIGNALTDAVVWISEIAIPAIGNFVKENWQQIVSGAEIIAGVACIFIPGMQWAIPFLLGMGISSLAGGYANQAAGGSFSAGWWGGQVTGFISGFGGGGFGFLGGFLGNATTGLIDKWVYGRDISYGTILGTSLLAGTFNMIANAAMPDIGFGVARTSDWFRTAVAGYLIYGGISWSIRTYLSNYVLSRL